MPEKMYGDRMREHWGGGGTKKGIRAREERQWHVDYLSNESHSRGFCTNFYCYECCDDIDLYWDAANDNSDLDDIPGVWCNVDYRNDFKYD